MTLTTVVGSSGSGKTTFLNDVHKRHKCVYIRQYHKIRPNIVVSKLPNFDPTRLPYWDVYRKEGKADKIHVGGTLLGQSISGLSGGQRKMLLFELICQRIKAQKDLLIVLDEPFAGVTDDFVPFITERLQEIRQRHNILLVTNDHVRALTELSDNTITVSAIDRKLVRINDRDNVDRDKAILALSLGDDYTYSESNLDDFKFFLNVEIMQSNILFVIAVFTLVSFGLMVISFWDTDESAASLVVVGTSLVAFFCANPYVVSLAEWRNVMREESEALVHSSKGTNKFYKTILTLIIILLISLVEYGCLNVVVSGLNDITFWLAVLFDNAYVVLPFIILGIYTTLSFHTVGLYGLLPFLFMLFFSTAFSPGSGIPGVKSLRYLCPRFYFWCMLPDVQNLMEGCPPKNTNTLYLILSSLLSVFIFIVYQVIKTCRKTKQKKVQKTEHSSMMVDDTYIIELQKELYGDKFFRQLNDPHSTNSIRTTSTDSCYSPTNNSQMNVADTNYDSDSDLISV